MTRHASLIKVVVSLCWLTVGRKEFQRSEVTRSLPSSPKRLAVVPPKPQSPGESFPPRYQNKTHTVVYTHGVTDSCPCSIQIARTNVGNLRLCRPWICWDLGAKTTRLGLGIDPVLAVAICKNLSLKSKTKVKQIWVKSWWSLTTLAC